MPKNESKRNKILCVIGVAIIILAGVAVSLKIFDNTTNVPFERLDKDGIPKEYAKEVIPEYRGIERALACKIGNFIYVMVTRGEKATSGYDVSIKKIVLEEKDGKTNLAVYARFTDPKGAEGLSQMITYPLQVVKTNLKGLPDEIELRIEFEE